MRFNQHLAAVILVATFAAGFNSPARADAEEYSPADLATIKSYTLTTDFLEKWTAMNQDPNVLACHVDALTLRAETIDDRAKEYEARPGVHAALAAHGLTARDVVLGTTNIAVAGLQALREKRSWLDDDSAPLPVSAANVQFYREHDAELRQLNEISRQRSREDRRKKKARCPG